MAKQNLTVSERFWSKVDKNGPIHPVKSTAKAAAARVNGAKGGRPKTYHTTKEG